jgi:hypothetical protein
MNTSSLCIYCDSPLYDKTAILDSHNFLTFGYEDRVYTLLMPSFGKHKQQYFEQFITTFKGVSDEHLSNINYATHSIAVPTQ